ncbi:hypothetical protein AVEN_94584-1 [Araneus ventricosus]|uniref:Uncharacterized protein n=1 Tax=Araneus ventricosus TaxID=182803 RepID=A0A4Y2ILG1_ARAVE|nr:hypothetical protein AVEN_94584-1 [Araneus ventricosus]
MPSFVQDLHNIRESCQGSFVLNSILALGRLVTFVPALLSPSLHTTGGRTFDPQLQIQFLSGQHWRRILGDIRCRIQSSPVLNQRSFSRPTWFQCQCKTV